jgi:hypothetical protein
VEGNPALARRPVEVDRVALDHALDVGVSRANLPHDFDEFLELILGSGLLEVGNENARDGRGGELPQNVQLNAAIAVKLEDRLWRGAFFRQVQGSHVGLEVASTAHSGTVEHQLLAADHDALVQFDAFKFDLCLSRCGPGQQRRSSSARHELPTRA